MVGAIVETLIVRIMRAAGTDTERTAIGSSAAGRGMVRAVGEPPAVGSTLRADGGGRTTIKFLAVGKWTALTISPSAGRSMITEATLRMETLQRVCAGTGKTAIGSFEVGVGRARTISHSVMRSLATVRILTLVIPE